MFFPAANSLKRGREDEVACDSADGGMLGFTEHRNVSRTLIDPSNTTS